MKCFDRRREEIERICAEAVTLTEVERRMNYPTPYRDLRSYIRLHKIPMPNFLGQKAGALSRKGPARNAVSTADLVVGSTRFATTIRNFLFRSGLKKRACERCGWARARSDGIVPVEVHHRNGESTDNRIENIEILCPNCHSLCENHRGASTRTPGGGGRRRPIPPPGNPCTVCGKPGYGRKYCSPACAGKVCRRTEWPDHAQLKAEVKRLGWSAVGRKYGVSDNAVRKWMRAYESRTQKHQEENP